MAIRAFAQASKRQSTASTFLGRLLHGASGRLCSLCRARITLRGSQVLIDYRQEDKIAFATQTVRALAPKLICIRRATRNRARTTMLFLKTKLPGVFEIHIEPNADDRGFFARTWCQQEFEAQGLNPKLVQCSVSFNPKQGTLRGMHFQAPQFEAKMVRCTQGAIYDVAVDMRTDSPTYKDWIAVQALTAQNRKMVYVPEECAHGFLTLENDSEVFYQMSEFYHPESTRGFRWDDPAFRIAWPRAVEVISDRDRTYADFR